MPECRAGARAPRADRARQSGMARRPKVHVIRRTLPTRKLGNDGRRQEIDAGTLSMLPGQQPQARLGDFAQPSGSTQRSRPPGR